MVKFRRPKGWARVLPAILVAVAMLFAPLAGAMPMPCHDHDETILVLGLDDGQALSSRNGMDHTDTSSDSADHGRCCSLSCGVSVLVKDGVDLEVRHLTFSRTRLNLADQLDDGLAVSPGLDPPRFQV
ncbi:hypothetical protein [Xanthobacter autotrophicus]